MIRHVYSEALYKAIKTEGVGGTNRHREIIVKIIRGILRYYL